MATSASSTSTVLRIKRSRSVDPLNSLQFLKQKRIYKESVGDIADRLASSDISSTDTNILTWKRIETSLSQSKLENTRKKRSFKFVDATLSRLDPKKPKLALTLEKSSVISPSKHKKSKHIILDPTTRLVVQKMKEVQEGSVTLREYLEFLSIDERVCHEKVKLLSTTMPDGGNVLHLAALWNNVEEARLILQSYPRAISIHAVDESGNSPYQLSVLAGNDQISTLLEEFGADKEEYVYDVYQLVTDEEEGQKNSELVELHGGVGYLNEHGELILESLCPEDYAIDSEDEFPDDDVDSNDENNTFNDYPDEIDNDDESDDSNQSANFRHSRIHMNHELDQLRHLEFSEGLEDAEYDAQYGHYDGQLEYESPSFYAYDPDLDDHS
jgi:Transcription factor Iwr1